MEESETASSEAWRFMTKVVMLMLLPLALTIAKSQGAWLRTQAALHVTKCRDRFQPLFKGKTSFEDWLRDVAKITTWAEGAIIQATAEKLGVPIVVWHYAPCLDNREIKECSRFVLATRFSKGYACCARGKQAAVVILHDRHYTALVPPKDTPVPMSWTKDADVRD